MIFVTVGTHEQPFDRLVEAIDKMREMEIITEEVIVQTGFSTYEPRFCKWSKLFKYQEMLDYVKDARIVITHGGPSSFIMPLQVGKVPVVVPRQKKFNEHVNDHQVEFSRAVEERQGNIIVVEEIKELKNIILNYDTVIKGMSAGIVSNNERFNREFGEIVKEVLEERIEQ